MNIREIAFLLICLTLLSLLTVACGNTDGSKPSDSSSEEQLDPSVPVGTVISVKYSSHSSLLGSVEGETEQTIKYGQTRTTTVTAVANPGYKFAYWSDGVTDATRENESPSEHTQLVAYFELAPYKLPMLYINTDDGKEITSKEYYVGASLSVYNSGEDNDFTNLPIQMRGRGNYTWDSAFNRRDPMYNKRPYRLKLSESKSLCGVGEGKSRDWVLLADHCDQSLLRNNIVYTAAAAMPHIYWQPDVQSVEVFLNGEYIGVYLLCEQVEVNKNKVNISEDLSKEEISYLAMFSNYTDLSNIYGFDLYGYKYEIKNDLSDFEELAIAQRDYIYDSIAECFDAIRSGDEEEVRELIDLDSLIETYFIHEVFKNLDTGHDNFYLYREPGGKLIIGPVWDFDQCAGNADEGVDDYENIRGGFTQPWYALLLEEAWFRKAVTEKWNQLKPTFDKIPELITTTAEYGYDSYCRNFEKWQIFGYKINRETYVRQFTTYDEHYKYFAEFMTNRIKWIDSYFNDPQYSFEPGDDFEGDGTLDSPYLINSVADFMTFTHLLSTGETFSGKVFMQTADIVLTQNGNTYEGLGKNALFSGIYNGNGYSIYADIQGNDGCIFPYVDGVIINVVTKGSVNNRGNAGGIARSVRTGGAIINCISYMNIINGSNVGGIVSSNQAGSYIINCFFGGTVNGDTAAPICVWYEYREGTYINNYYVNGTRNDTENVYLERDENGIDKNQISRLLAGYMNGYLEDIDPVILQFVRPEHVCIWNYVGSQVILVHNEILN